MIASSEQRNREMFFSLMGYHMKQLYRFARQEIDCFEAVGDLLPGELAPGDVVDAMVLRAYREYLTEPARLNLSGWLIRLAKEELEAQVRALNAARESSDLIEDGIPPAPPRQETPILAEEVLYFCEPEEEEILEDVVPGLEVPTPGHQEEARDLRVRVREALKYMPRDWRRALLLHHAEGLQGEELAEAVGRPESELGHVLEESRDYLRERLVEAGCHFHTAA